MQQLTAQNAPVWTWLQLLSLSEEEGDRIPFDKKLGHLKRKDNINFVIN